VKKASLIEKFVYELSSSFFGKLQFWKSAHSCCNSEVFNLVKGHQAQSADILFLLPSHSSFRKIFQDRYRYKVDLYETKLQKKLFYAQIVQGAFKIEWLLVLKSKEEKEEGFRAVVMRDIYNQNLCLVIYYPSYKA
jgi:hypothetical protein